MRALPPPTSWLCLGLLLSPGLAQYGVMVSLTREGSVSQLGFSVSSNSLNRVLAGAPFSAGGGLANSGDAYLWDCDSAPLTRSCSFLARLTAPTPTAEHLFGTSVAISEQDLVVVGAHPGPNALGAAFVFDCSAPVGGSCTYLTSLAPATTEPSEVAFGRSVAVNNGWVVGGDFHAEVGGQLDAGAVHVWDCSKATPSVSCTAIGLLVSPDPGEFDRLGYSVAINRLKWVVGGAHHADLGALDQPGSLFVWDCSKATAAVSCTYIGRLNAPSPAAGDLLGEAVSINDLNMVVGGAPGMGGDVGAVLVWDCALASPSKACAFVARLTSPLLKAGDILGSSVAINTQAYVIGGAPNAQVNDNGGSGLLFVWYCGTAAGCNYIGDVESPTAGLSEHFGTAVSFTKQNWITSGSIYPDPGAVHVFQGIPSSGGDPTPTPGSAPASLQAPLISLLPLLLLVQLCAFLL